MFGLDEEIEKEESENPKPKKNMPFAFWEVGGTAYRLKLTTSNICRLEEKYRSNLINIITADGIPPLNIMLTVIQAAMLPYHHGIKMDDIQSIYEQYISEGGSQIKLLSDVIMQIFAVSGFFTQTQAEALTEKMNDVEELI